jgi:hypothetical protein
MLLKIVKYVRGCNFPKTEKFKYAWKSTGGYSRNTATEASNIGYPSTVQMFNMQKRMYFKRWGKGGGVYKRSMTGNPFFPTRILPIADLPSKQW